jgi:heptaprenyl diphosphate synthase
MLLSTESKALSMKEVDSDHRISKVALLISLACVLQIAESMIPHPIPGLRLGLANMLTLTAMVVLGFGYALEVAILRTVLSSFILGTFMSPGFILSLSGAVTSALIMGFFYWVSGLHPRCRLSIIGISIIGAFTHNIVQLYLAYLLLVKHAGIFVFFPWLSLGAVATGWIVGTVTGGVCRKLEEMPEQRIFQGIRSDIRAPVDGQYAPGSSLLHRLHARTKIFTILILALTILMFNHFWLYICLFLLLFLAAAISRTPVVLLLKKGRRYLSLVSIAFFLPIVFNSGTTILASIGSFRFTYEGLSTGSLFASRLLVLIYASFLLVRTTSPEEMTEGLADVLLPLRYLGISQRRVATILSIAWTAIPDLWETTRKAIFTSDLRKARNLRSLLPLLSTLIATLT